MNWNDSKLLKNYLAYSLFCYCTCILISVYNNCVFDTGADGVTNIYMEDHLG